MQIRIAILFIFLLAACKKDSSKTVPPHTGPDVYLTGYEGLRSVYWKNGELVPLTGGQFATAIAFIGEDIYVAGNAGYAMPGGGGEATEAVYWKNGVMVKLGNPPSYASSMMISGNDIYIAGNAEVNNQYVAVYWKNGNLVSLGDIPYSSASGIAVTGTDVYVSGVSGPTGQRATYWKNGNPVFLADSSIGSRANAIVLSGADVFVAGYAADDGNSKQAVYWKNGNRVNLNPASIDPQVVFTYASAIAVADTNVYVTGYMNNYYALYWKNGIQTSLNNPAQYENMTNNDNGIVVSGSDVYISFNSSDYWKNDSIVHVGNGYATNITVRP